MGVHLNGNEILTDNDRNILIFDGTVNALKYLLNMYDKEYLREQLYRYEGIQINLWEKDN
jgi:hypothetical protein